MHIDFLKLLTLDEAKSVIRKEISYLNEDRTVTQKLVDSLGMILAKKQLATFNLPPFDRSTVDGYAVLAKETQGASDHMPSMLKCIGEVQMGEVVRNKMSQGQCIYVPTGGMIPEGADAMVMIEHTEKLDGETILIKKCVSEGNHISYKGDDIQVHDTLLEVGEKIEPYSLAMLAGMGISRVQVFEPPVVTVISTGDEIIDLEEANALGKIRDINGYGIEAWLKTVGCNQIHRDIVKDDFKLLKDSVEKALLSSDIIIISGGSSMGYRDYTKDLIDSFDEGRVLMHGLAIKPGKPTILGTVNHKMIFGLPGHPVSALMVCRQLVGYYLDEWFKRKAKPLSVSAKITENIHGAPGRDMYQMVQLVQSDDGLKAIPIYGKSGLITTLVMSSGWFVIGRESEGVTAGDMVEVYLLEEARL